jgi:hypothetical protein
MCGGCRVRVGDETKFACVDGPDFDGHQVDFADLMSRLTRFKEDEAVALDRWSGAAAPSAPPKPADDKPELQSRANGDDKNG